jgi:hypothetical protein
VHDFKTGVACKALRLLVLNAASIVFWLHYIYHWRAKTVAVFAAINSLIISRTIAGHGCSSLAGRDFNTGNAF